MTGENGLQRATAGGYLLVVLDVMLPGINGFEVLRRITIPLVLPGLAAAASLVWLSATTELTATLLLRPTGLRTLATQFWVYTTGLAYGAAAPYAAIMIGVSVIPVVLLTRLARSPGAPADAVHHP